MRIRSVKPEFWSHPVTGRQPGEVQAFLIGLLNHSDDHGYFFAEPTAVRSAIKPYDENTDACRALLAKAIAIGWCEVRISPTHGAIGFIATFSEHQYVQKPRESQIKKYWDVALPDSSGTHPVALPAVLERIGREGIVEEGEVGAAPEAPATKPPPPSIPIAAFEVSKPDIERIESWTKEEFWCAAEHTRRAAGFPPERWPSPRVLSTWWSEARGMADVRQLADAFVKFSVSPRWLKADPPAPFVAFAKVWNQYLPRGTPHAST